ncbi:MAG: hypothetical protein KGQ32_02185 [Xanthomonadaceae bacterium]|nr:hypothetical protein [Xanthomonadaceae bacterium]MDE2224669.1 hypothetical protein [Xanthomonadaceae bacterium]
MRTAMLPIIRWRAGALAVASACALALAACHHAPPPPSNATPEKAVATSLRLTATGDFDGLMKNRLPPADYMQWRSEWDAAHARPGAASATQDQQFEQIMRMLTEPGAEAKLAKRLQPGLAKLHGGKDQTMPIASGILEAAGKQMIAASPQLGPTQKTLATEGLAALIAWTKTTDFSDPKKATRAIALVCATARQLHMQTLAQWRAQDYAQTMRSYGVLWNGLESLLNIYGLDIPGSLTAAEVTATANDGARATIKLDMKLAGQSLSGEWPMMKQAGHWYDAALLEAWQTAHPASAGTAAASPTSATSAAGIAPTASSTPAPASSAKPVPSSGTPR